MNWTDRVRSAFGTRPVDDQVVEELAQHAALAYERIVADVPDGREAERRIDALLVEWAANPALVGPRRRRIAAPPAPEPARSRLAGLGQELRHAWRLLRRQPAYSAVAVATMALGIGTTTVLVSLAYGVLLKPLPWPEPERIVRLYETRQGATNRFGSVMTSGPYAAWREDPATIEGIAAWSVDRVTVDTGSEPTRIRVASATASLFPVIGLTAILGTPYGEGDVAQGSAERPAVISHGFWLERYGGRRDVIGASLRIDGRPHRVVAVMPPDFTFPDAETRLWTPMTVRFVKNGLSIFNAVARLKPGVTAAQAAAEGTARARSGPDPGPVVMAVFGSRAPAEISVVPFLESQIASVRPAILLFLAAVGLLLATAIANTASLQLARGTVRRREMAVRMALGAGAWRLVRLALAENVLIGLAGGAAGLLLAWQIHRALPSLLPAAFPRLADVRVDLTAAAVAFGLSLLASLACGLLPALQARRVPVAGSLTEDGRGGGEGGSLRSARWRAAIIAGQLAVACVLLLGASLLTRSFYAMLTSDRGYDPAGVLTATLSLPEGGESGATVSASLAGLLDRLKATPGFSRVALATALPLMAGETLASFPVVSGATGETVQAQAASRVVSRDYFATLGIRLLEGRSFDDRDTPSSQPVVVVNRAFAAKYLGDAPLGRQLWKDSKTSRGPVVIGIIENVRHRSATDVPAPEIYRAFEQGTQGGTPHTIAARTPGNPAARAAALRAIVRQHDAAIGVESVAPLESLLMTSLLQPRLYSVLSGSLAALALVIAGVGLFGVLGYTVGQRTREIGVRSALGARPIDIAIIVLRQGLAMTAVGLAVGLSLSWAASRLVVSLLYGVTTSDPISYLVVAVLLFGAAAVACAVPARRAVRIDPTEALRN